VTRRPNVDPASHRSDAAIPRRCGAIGGQYGKSAGQVALRWLLDQPYVTTLPKASSHERRLESFQVFDFHLSDADRERIAVLPKDVRTANPSWAPDWDG
jgi:diketogulonate reductase-like aldo/keto reductase